MSNIRGPGREDPVYVAALHHVSGTTFTGNQARAIARAIAAAVRKSHSLAQGRGRGGDR